VSKTSLPAAFLSRETPVAGTGNTPFFPLLLEKRRYQSQFEKPLERTESEKTLPGDLTFRP